MQTDVQLILIIAYNQFWRPFCVGPLKMPLETTSRHCKAPDKAPDGTRHNSKVYSIGYYSLLNASVGKDFLSIIYF
jgi:hypothetical protein